MVRRYYYWQIKIHLKEWIFLAVIIAIIANLISGDFVSAKKFEINKQDVERIKDFLDFVKTYYNITISDEKLKTILNTAIRVGDTSTDITYGLLVLRTFNEMELIDLVVSQRYKTEAAEYFNQVLDERLNLIAYWKGVGLDLPRVLSGQITGKMSALTLNSFEITDKVIQIFVGFENIALIKKYDGLWWYFHARKNNESHEVAWDEAKEAMGFAAYGGIEGLFIIGKKAGDARLRELESQFAALYEKWGPYVTPFGISQEVKAQTKNELRDILVKAIEDYNLAQKEKKPSSPEKIKLAVGNLGEKIKEIGTLLKKTGQAAQKVVRAGLAKIISEIKELGRFGGAKVVPPLEEKPSAEVRKEVGEVTSKEEKKEEITEKEKPEVGQEIGQKVPTPGVGKLKTREERLAEIQKKLDDISEEIDVLSQKIAQLAEEKGAKLISEEKNNQRRVLIRVEEFSTDWELFFV